MMDHWLTMDSALLVSICNTKLRNDYATLADLCEDFAISLKEFLEHLDSLGYYYDTKQQQIKKK